MRTRHVASAVSLLVVMALAGCAAPPADLRSSTVMRPYVEPLPARSTGAEAGDARIAVVIDAAIVGDGPGSWVFNPAWDEYLISVRAQAAQPIRVTGVALKDSMGTRVDSRTDFKSLVEGTRDAARRSQESEVLANAVPRNAWGAGDYLAVAGGGATLAAGAGLASIAGAVALPVALPVTLIVLGGSTMAAPALGRMEFERKVDRKIQERRTALPVTVQGEPAVHLDLFFPVTPLPAQVDIVYEDADGEHRLAIDTTATLAGLHIDRPPRLQRREDPVFPAWAREAGHEGYVKGRLSVGADGFVTHVQVLESVPAGVFDNVAERAWYRWRYDWGRPARTVEEVIRFDKQTMH